MAAAAAAARTDASSGLPAGQQVQHAQAAYQT
jgi:hypothetical protein